MADIPIPWKKRTRGLPNGRRYADDRISTIEEIRKIIEYPNRRIKAIVYTMTSSGMGLGAWDYLKWGNIKPVQGNGKIVAANMIVYTGEDESTLHLSLLPYQTFPWNYDNIHDASTLCIVIMEKSRLRC
jgi:hypothetical protein